MDEFYVRAQLINNRAQRLVAEGRSTRDIDRLCAITAELNLLVASMYELREEQLIASLPPPPEKKRRWWQRSRSTPAE